MEERKLKIGIIQTYILIFIQILFALTFLIDFLAENYDEKKEIIYQVSNVYIYVSILMLIRRLTIENKVIVKYISWIIKLEVLRAVCNILVSIKVHQASIFDFLFGLTLLILYIILIINILKKKYNDKVEITGLRPFVIALIMGFIVALIGGIYTLYNLELEFFGVLYIILTIPYVFLIGYFRKMKEKIIEIPSDKVIE
jgi:hypothetical protein